METNNITIITEEEQIMNTHLLSTFITIFSASNFNNLKFIFHEDGVFFGNLNRQNAIGYFYNIFFSKYVSSKKNHIDINYGTTLDHLPGEMVLELRCSLKDPLSNDFTKKSNKLGDKADASIEEAVYRFAITFKDNKIFTIRIPSKYIENWKELSKYN